MLRRSASLLNGTPFGTLGSILFNDLGLKPAKGVEKITKNFEVVFQEVFPDYDADAIFVLVGFEEGNDKVAK